MSERSRELPATARVLSFVGPRQVELQEAKLPAPAEGQVLVATELSGISGGTEMLAWRGELDPELPLDETIGALSGTFSYPFPYGYSCVGRVEAGYSELPEGALVFAFHPHQDRFVADAADVTVVEGLPAREATLYPLMETALQVANDAEVAAGQVAVVQGLGAVGVLAAVLLARDGARVIGSEPAAWRRRAATAFGVDSVGPDELPAAVDDASGGSGADLAVEASGNPKALAQGLEVLGHEGTALVCSWYGTQRVELPLGAEFHRRRLSIVSTQVSSIPRRQQGRWDRRRRSEAAWALLRELPVAALATHEFAFEEAAGAYEAIDRGEEGLIHAALRYR